MKKINQYTIVESGMTIINGKVVMTEQSFFEDGQLLAFTKINVETMQAMTCYYAPVV